MFKRLKLHGVLSNGEFAKTHQASQVVGFKHLTANISLHLVKGDAYELKSDKAKYRLNKLTPLMYGTDVPCNGFTFEFRPKKVVAELKYKSM